MTGWMSGRTRNRKTKICLPRTKGFQDALTGCYMSLASQDIYGERLTMSNIESLANLWYQFRNSTRYEDNDLMNHDYTGRLLQDCREDHLRGLFNVIAQANMIIKYAEKNGRLSRIPRLVPLSRERHTLFVLFASWTCCVCSGKNAARCLPASGITLFRNDLD